MKPHFKRVKNYFHNRKYLYSIPLLALLIIYLHYVNSLTFAFTDAYQSFVRAYFMDKGRTLFAEIFSHHNFLMVYLSYAIQKISDPESLYQLVMFHRMFVAFFSLAMSALLIWRFRWPGVLFVLVFETSKYYLFGNLFLAESFVAYLLVFLLGIAWEKMRGEKLSRVDIVLSVLSAWAIAFLREPFIPAAFVLFLYILLGKKNMSTKIASVVLLSLFSFGVILLTLDINEYYFHLITLNFGGYIQEELGSGGSQWISIFKSFTYPIVILVEGRYTDFRAILLLVDMLFILSITRCIRQKNYRFILALLLVLGLSNIRVRPPGSVFYDAFNMLPYYALLTFSSLKIALESKSKYLKYSAVAVAAAVVLISTLPPYSTAIRDTSREEEFTTNFGRFYASGEVIRILSNEGDTLFVDKWDTLIFYQTGLDSSYKYAMFFPVMESFEKYTAELRDMFGTNPPEFYYTDCGKKTTGPLDQDTNEPMYSMLYFGAERTCIYVRNDKISQIEEEKWNTVKSMGYYFLAE